MANLYHALLHRAPQPGELDAWAPYLQRGMTDAQLAAGFTASAEYRTNQIADAYLRLLGRDPELGVADLWLGHVTAGRLDDETFTVAVLASAEYYARQGGANAAWVAALYRDVLGRLPDDAGLASWEAALRDGATRRDVARGFLDSPECHAQVVTDAYWDLLGRMPEPAGLAWWAGALANGMTPGTFTTWVAASTEFLTRAATGDLAPPDGDITLSDIPPSGEVGRLGDPDAPLGTLATGPDAGSSPRVKVLDPQTLRERLAFLAYADTFRGGVRVAVGDLNADGTPDVVTGPGPGGGALVRAFDGRDGTPLPGPLGGFRAYAAGSGSGGVHVAAGDVNGDGYADVVTGTDQGGQPLVKVYSGRNGALLSSFFADAAKQTGGVRVAAGDVNGDGLADVVTGSGPGGLPRVGAFDATTRREFYNFLAYDGTFRGGVHVAVGDVDGDGFADIVTGSGPGARAEIHTYSGYDSSPLGNHLAFEASARDGVRVAAADVNGDGQADLVAASGPGGGRLRVLDGQSRLPLEVAAAPYGSSATHGLFAAGAASSGALPTPGDGAESPGGEEVGAFGDVGALTETVVTVTANVAVIREGGSTGVFTITRAGDLTDTLSVPFSLGGSATAVDDYTTSLYSGYTLINAGESTTTLVITPVADGLLEKDETVVLTVLPYLLYTVGTPDKAVLTIDDDSPAPVPPDECTECGCGSDNGLFGVGRGIPQGGVSPVRKSPRLPPLPSPFSREPVRYLDGALKFSETDLGSTGFGLTWGQTRSWTNAAGYVDDADNGNGNVTLPFLMEDDNGTIAVVTDGTTARFFDPDGSDYVPRFYLQEQLSYDSGSGEFVFTDTTGNELRFHDFDTGLPAEQRGAFQSHTDPKGHVTEVVSRASDGDPTEIQRAVTVSSVTTTESYQYAYISSGTNAGKVSSVTLRRKVGSGSWSTVRQAEYAYYGSSESHGNLGDLKTATIKDGSGVTIDTSYYRYYTGESGGYTGALKYRFNAASYARLAAAFSNPLTATDSQVAPYADQYLKYDAARRVSEEVVQGAGCTTCGGSGLGTYTFSYTASTFPDGYNNWARKIVEVLPDGTEHIVYTNCIGEIIIDIIRDVTSEDEWVTYNRYDNDGRLILRAHPSSVSGIDESRPDLLNNQSGNYSFLRDGEGLIETISYYTSTTATETTAGGATGYQYQTKVQRGEAGTAILQSTTQYYARTDGDATVYPTANETVYRNTDGSGGQTTSYTYTWFSSSTQMQSVTVTMPTVSTSQNGPGSADVTTTFYDEYGRPIWSKDGDGFLSYTAYDQATGAVTKMITDVNTSNTSDFANLPSGWSTPSGGGLHLITTMEVDHLGRTTKLTDPNGNVTYTVYDDDNYEVRVYPGWNSSTNTPTGPTRVMREDRANNYTETLTMSATPNVSGGRPTGTESISSIQTLSRTYRNNAGQTVRADAYFNLSGVTYSTNTYIGTQNTHYYTTLTDYDARGRQVRTVTPTGTIYRTVYDGLDRAVSSWVGLDDTPTSGDWSPTNTSGTDLVKVSENVYDGGGVGDGNLTQVTQIPGGSATNRVSQMFYDWRNRQVATKGGVQASEGTDVQRPISYTEYDNLSQSVAQEQYDGDNVTIGDANSDGVPDKPSSSLLRARSTAEYDEQGRVFRSHVYSVDQSSGSVSSNSLKSDTWFNHRGQPIKSAQPGGLVQKMAYDGAGRTTVSYTTDGGSDSSWSDAGTVTGDAVLSLAEYTYDAGGRVLLVTQRDRFHDETATGSLGNPTTAPKARVSYVASYYDLANRTTDTVNVGTNGGSSYTRPSSVPSRSDTVLVSSQSYNAAGWVESTTDPRGIVGKTYYDNLGRTTKTIEAHVDGVPSNSDDKTTEFTYDGNGNMLTLKAHWTSGAYQTTQWIYGVTTSSGSDFNCNDCLSAMRYPDKSSGNPSSSEQETYTVNALQQRKTLTDRNGSLHTYSYDILGRTLSDAVTTLGSGVDDAVRRLETAYDTAGRPYLYTSYDATSSGTVVNQVQQVYNGLSQLITEYQATSGAVNTSTTPKVQYAYSEMSGGANHSRLVSMTYPNGRAINYNYSAGLDSNISRRSSQSYNSATLETYTYLGQGTVVKRGHTQSGVDLTYIKQIGESNGDAGDQYTGLDRFGRIVDQRWIKTNDSSHTDRFLYGYDRNGNRLYRTNELNHNFDELYHANGSSNGYDLLNQLTDFQRGTLNSAKDSIAGTPSRTQSWSFDALGNWTTLTTDGVAESRTHNRQNQVTAVGSNSLTFDNNGNTTTDQSGKPLVYDAWNRLAQVKQGSTVLTSYSYDVLKRRVSENPGTARTLYYSAQWQVVEERESGVVLVQQVWSPVYVDAMILRDRNANVLSGDGLEERLYVQQYLNWDTAALLSSEGLTLERYFYDAFGRPSYLSENWSAISMSEYMWPNLHQGSRIEAVSVLYLFRNRNMSYVLGRWIEVDPLGVDSRDFNLYRYISNSPLSLLDPLGLKIVDTRYTPGFKVCQRDIIATSTYDDSANKCGGQHTYIQFGPVDKQGQPIAGTEGWGFAVPVGAELAFRPNSCMTCRRTKKILRHGISGGKNATNATDAEIWDCIKKNPPKSSYNCCCYNCKDWSHEAVEACGLECRNDVPGWFDLVTTQVQYEN